MEFNEGLEFLTQQGAILAMLPLDPTAYRKYIHSGRREMLLDILRAAFEFKVSILKAQRGVLEGTIT